MDPLINKYCSNGFTNEERIKILTEINDIISKGFIYEFSDLFDKNYILNYTVNPEDTIENLEKDLTLFQQNIKYLKNQCIPDISQGYEKLHNKYKKWSDKLKTKFLSNDYKEKFEIKNIFEEGKNLYLIFDRIKPDFIKNEKN